MSISVVNGYACASCSDISKAKKGQDPSESLAEHAAKQAEVAAEKTRNYIGVFSQLGILV